MVFAYPFTIQHIREAIPRSAWRSVTIRTRAFLTSALFVAVFVANTLLVSLAPLPGLTIFWGATGRGIQSGPELLMPLLLCTCFFWQAVLYVHMGRSS